ncbi:uncharacterized protein LOC105685949 [Athalia rosae]|uniref:uncharacterized protein LOC105685949 n=1 Tax=Athalia rosae TaxID=37344 RepID=UPI0020349000|nr:uncharacterized protein LOC105685949 [Athalia rosae]
MVSSRDGGGDEDKISLITAASTTPQESLKSAETGIPGIDVQRKFEPKPHQKVVGGRIFSYRKRKPSEPNSLFAAPPGVNPHHMSSSSSRRNPGGSRLVFIWPQKTRTRGRLLCVMAPLIHGALVGLLCLDAVHLWPGEFLPTCLPSSSPSPQPPVQCNIIEPLWCDNT